MTINGALVLLLDLPSLGWEFERNGRMGYRSPPAVFLFPELESFPACSELQLALVHQ